jgi:hypothetical protein
VEQLKWFIASVHRQPICFVCTEPDDRCSTTSRDSRNIPFISTLRIVSGRQIVRDWSRRMFAELPVWHLLLHPHNVRKFHDAFKKLIAVIRNRSTVRRSWLSHNATSRKVIGFYSWLNPSNRTMALVSIQPLTEMSTRDLPGSEKRPARKADNLTASCERSVK